MMRHYLLLLNILWLLPPPSFPNITNLNSPNVTLSVDFSLKGKPVRNFWSSTGMTPQVEPSSSHRMILPPLKTSRFRSLVTLDRWGGSCSPQTWQEIWPLLGPCLAVLSHRLKPSDHGKILWNYEKKPSIYWISSGQALAQDEIFYFYSCDGKGTLFVGFTFARTIQPSICWLPRLKLTWSRLKCLLWVINLDRFESIGYCNWLQWTRTKDLTFPCSTSYLTR